MRRSEHSLQITVAHMLTLVLDPTKTFWSSIDHGVGKLGPAEAGIRKRRGVKPGIPDVIVMWSVALTGPELLGIELKAGKGTLSPAQKEVRDAWGRLGVQIYTARSLEEVQEILEHCRVPMRRRMNLMMGGDHAGKSVVRSPTLRHKRPSRRGKPKVPLPQM